MRTEQINIMFVQEVEKNPCLYNFNLPEYTRKDITEMIWSKVGEKFNMTGPESKEKWRNIRSVFVRNIRPSKSGSPRNKKKPYYLQNAMRFALPFIKPNDSCMSGNLPIAPIVQLGVDNDNIDGKEPAVLETGSTQETTISNDYLNFEQQSNPPMPSPSVEFSRTFPQYSTTRLSSPEPQASSSSSPNPSRPKRKERESDVVNKIVDYLKSKQPRKDLQNNPRKMFMLSLMPEVEAMTDIQMRCFKRKIIDVIEEILTDPLPDTYMTNDSLPDS